MAALSGCNGDKNGDDADAGSVTGTTPDIIRLAWVTTLACREGSPTNYTVTTTAADSDTPTKNLTFMGSVSGCTPAPFTTSPATISCPNTPPQTGTMVVRDPEGHMDSQAFTIEPCISDMVP